MDLQPFTTDRCVMCGDAVADYRFCTGACRRVPGGYVDTRTLGEGDRPHQHRTCRRCGYTWLTQTAPAKTSKPVTDAADGIPLLSVRLNGTWLDFVRAVAVVRDPEPGVLGGWDIDLHHVAVPPGVAHACRNGTSIDVLFRRDNDMRQWFAGIVYVVMCPKRFSIGRVQLRGVGPLTEATV